MREQKGDPLLGFARGAITQNQQPMSQGRGHARAVVRHGEAEKGLAQRTKEKPDVLRKRRASFQRRVHSVPNSRSSY